MRGYSINSYDATILDRASARPRLAQALGRLWRFRNLLAGLIARNLKVRYQRSVLGFAWTLLNPLLTVGVLLGVFTLVIPLELPSYWAFLLSGYFVWNFLVNTLNTSAFTMHDHADMTRNMPFPSETLVIGAALARLAEFGVALVPVAAVLAVFHHHALPAAYLVLPVLAALQVLLVIGLALPIATLSVFYRDLQHALPVALTLLAYVSPVFYPAQYVPESLRPLYFVNPAAGLLTLFHTVLYEGNLPSLSLFAGVAAQALLLALIGYAVFRRYCALFAETV